VDFELTPEQQALREAVRAFAEEVVAPAAAGYDEREEFPLEVVRRAAEMGLFGIPFPERWGGQGATVLVLHRARGGRALRLLGRDHA
jgi:butyryl-CoA dehydrogenase